MKEDIKQIISRLLRVEFIRFGIVGVVATVIHYGIYYLLILALNYNVAYTIGYVISFVANFLLSAKFTFKSYPTVSRGLGFAVSHLVNYGLQIAVLNVTVKIGIPQVLAPIPVYLICVPVNFLLVRLVFKKI